MAPDAGILHRALMSGRICSMTPGTPEAVGPANAPARIRARNPQQGIEACRNTRDSGEILEIDLMTKEDIRSELLKVFEEQFEIVDPDLDADLREAHEFDSIDAIELLREIEVLLGVELTREEKKRAMDIRSLNQIVDY